MRASTLRGDLVVGEAFELPDGQTSEFFAVERLHPAVVLLGHLRGELGSWFAADDLVYDGRTVVRVASIFNLVEITAAFQTVLIAPQMRQFVDRDADQQSPQPMTVEQLCESLVLGPATKTGEGAEGNVFSIDDPAIDGSHSHLSQSHQAFKKHVSQLLDRMIVSGFELPQPSRDFCIAREHPELLEVSS